MLLEGDWTDKEIPEYFKGIKSVGESENGSHSIELKSQNENLFLGFDHSGFKMRQVPDDRVLIKEKNRLKFITNGWNQGFYSTTYDIQDFAVYRKDKSEYVESQYSDKTIP